MILILFEYLPVLGLLISATITTHTITITYLILALKVSLLELDLLIGAEIIDLVDVVSMFAIIILLHVEQSFAVNRPFKVSSLDGFGLWHNFDHMLQLLLVFLCLKVSGADGALIAIRFSVWRRRSAHRSLRRRGQDKVPILYLSYSFGHVDCVGSFRGPIGELHILYLHLIRR